MDRKFENYANKIFLHRLFSRLILYNFTILGYEVCFYGLQFIL